jgi:hypothetical protein
LEFDPIDYFLIAPIAALLGVLASYAIRLIRILKKGMLESTWRYIAIGCILLFVAQLGFIASFFTPRIGYLDAIDFGFAFNLAGVAAMIFGFRAQLNVWKIGNKKSDYDNEKDGWRFRKIDP